MLLGASSASTAAGWNGERDEEQHQAQQAISTPARREDETDTQRNPHAEQSCEIVALSMGAHASCVRSGGTDGDGRGHNVRWSRAGNRCGGASRFWGQAGASEIDRLGEVTRGDDPHRSCSGSSRGSDRDVRRTRYRYKSRLNRELHWRCAVAGREAAIAVVDGRDAVIAGIEADDRIADGRVALAIEGRASAHHNRRVQLRIKGRDLTQSVAEGYRARGDSVSGLARDIGANKYETAEWVGARERVSVYICDLQRQRRRAGFGRDCNADWNGVAGSECTVSAVMGPDVVRGASG